MELKPWVVVVVVALLAMCVMSETIAMGEKYNGTVGDMVGEEEEMMMESESESIRRTLRQGRFISYDAMRANRIPCGQRGRSYYNCQRRARANPYTRGCTMISHCYRVTD